MYTIQSRLYPGEKILQYSKSSMSVFLFPLLWLLVTIYFGVVWKHSYFVNVSLIATVVLSVIAGIKYTVMEYAVTNQQVWVRAGIYPEQLLAIPFGEIDDVSMEQTNMGAALDYGSLTIKTSQGTLGPYTMVSRPEKFREQLEKLRILEPIPEVVLESKKERKARLKEEKRARKTSRKSSSR